MLNDQLINKVHKEIVNGGLRSQVARLECSRANLAFYKGDFLEAPVRPKGNTAYDSARYPRHSILMQRIIKILCKNLYAEGPIRKLSPPDRPAPLDPSRLTLDSVVPQQEDGPYDRATAWLNECYKRNRMDSKWQRADILSTVSEVAA